MSLLCVKQNLSNINFQVLFIYVDGFHQPFRRDNLKSGGGGIIVYVINVTIDKRRTDLEINDIDCLWIEISSRKGKSFLFHPVKVNSFL